MSVYVRWRRDQPREGAIVPPLAEGHPAADYSCLLCSEPLGNGTSLQLLALGPDDRGNREKHRAGRWYAALALMLHAECLGAWTGSTEGGEE